MMRPIARTLRFSAAALLAATLLAAPAVADGMLARGRVAAPAPAPEARPCTLSANAALASEYVFRASAQIETAHPDLNWLNLGVFTVVAGRQPDGVSFAVYIVE